MHVEVSSFAKILEAAFNEDEMSSTLRVRSTCSAFCTNYQRTIGCRSWKELVQVIICILKLFIVFSLLCIISTTIDYMHELCHTIQSYSYYMREGVAVNMQGTVFTSSRTCITSNASVLLN